MFDVAGIWCALIWCLYLIAVMAILVGDLFLVVCCVRLVVFLMFVLRLGWFQVWVQVSFLVIRCFAIIGIRGLGGLVFGFLGASDALRGGVLVSLFVFGLCGIRLLSGWVLAVIWFGGFGIDCCVYVGV